MGPEDAKPDAVSQEKHDDKITGKFKGRSVSLTRSDSRNQSSPKKTTPPTKKTSPGKGRKRKTPPESPPKMSFKERTSQFEQVRDKYKTQRCMKEFNHVKNDNKKEKKPKNNPDEEEGSIANLLKTTNANILSMKTDLKTNSEKIDGINDKIGDIEVKADRSEKEYKKRFDAINANVARIEPNVTDKVINVIDPKIKSIKAELKTDLAGDLKKLVQEEMDRRFPVSEEDDDPENKINKNKKNIFKIKKI